MLNKIKSFFSKKKPEQSYKKPELYQHPLIISLLNKVLTRQERSELITLIKQYGGKYSLTEITALIIQRRGGGKR